MTAVTAIWDITTSLYAVYTGIAEGVVQIQRTITTQGIRRSCTPIPIVLSMNADSVV